MIRIAKVLRNCGQWKVTTYGVECAEPGYSISWKQLRDGPGLRTWREHLFEKNWVDLVSFDRAHEAALAFAKGATRP